MFYESPNFRAADRGCKALAFEAFDFVNIYMVSLVLICVYFVVE